LKAQATLEVDCRDPRTKDSLLSVLTPDNEGGPRGLAISLDGRGSKLKVSIEAVSAATALSTSLAFLRDMALFQEVWLLSEQRRG
jgi:hypothetical protein